MEINEAQQYLDEVATFTFLSDAQIAILLRNKAHQFEQRAADLKTGSEVLRYVADQKCPPTEVQNKTNVQKCPPTEVQNKTNVHTEHCCKNCGCKYSEGEARCDVVTGRLQQASPCGEMCVCGGW